MECATASYPFPSISSPSHSPVPQQAVSGQRSPGNECYSCKRPGHWARDCPNKSPKKSAPASPSSSDNSMKQVSPMVRCPCGRGFCLIRESHTAANPDRMFYTCPVGMGQGKCGFFSWCDELSSITVRTPLCPCGAGICSVNKASSPGPNGEKWYFACRIKENYGACDFFQWAASEPCTMNKRDRCKRNGFSALQSRYNVANNDLDKKEMILESNVDSPLPQNAENSPDLPIITEQSQQDDVPNVDIVMKEVESLDPMTDNLIEVLQPMARFQSPCFKESWRNIYVAGNTITEDVLYQSLGRHVYGWLGRLAFPPSQCLKDPPSVPIFVCILPSVSPVAISEDVEMSNTNGSLLSPHTASNAETNLPPLETPRQDAQLSGVVLLEPSEHKDTSGIMQDSNVSSKSIVKAFGQALFDILESMNPLDPEGMLKVAEPTFIAFQKLSIECCPFVEGVKKYINNVSMLTSIEGSIQEGPSSQELIKLHEREKNQFDNVSRPHTEAEDAYIASNNHLQSLEQKVTRLKGELVELEQQLVDWKAKTSLVKARFDEASEDMSKSKISMEAASARMVKAFELEQHRESVRDAAKVALENARAWLEEM